MSEGPENLKSGYCFSNKSPVGPSGGQSQGSRIAVLATQWNIKLVDALVDGARRALQDQRIYEIREYRVPGALELPLMAELLMRQGQCDALVALGVIIRGNTIHFDLVAKECFRGLREASQRHLIPLGVGVLAVHDARQAAERSGGDRRNKGYEAAMTALELLDVIRKVND